MTAAAPGVRWPGDRNVAVVLNIAYEVWGDGKTSGVGPMGNPLPDGAFDDNADTYGRYGANAGIQRLMRALDRAGVQGSVFTSGLLGEQDPGQVRAVAEAGHEIVGHGWSQDLIPSVLSDADDESSIVRSTEILAEVTGTRPTGWISPRATAGERTLRLLAKHGYEYYSDSLESDVPYRRQFPEGDLWAVPLQIEFNDLPHAMRFGRTPRQFVEMFEDALPRLLANRDDVVAVDVLVHTHCYGRAANAWAYEEIARQCAASDEIWLTTRGGLARHAREALAAAAA